MKRMLVLGVLVGVGTLSIAVAGQAPPSGPTPKSLQVTKIEKVKDNLYIVTGSGAEDTDAFSGGNTAVFVTNDGVTLVDTKLPGWGPTILQHVRSVTNKPVTRIINTHAHGDHTGSNPQLAGPKVEAVVHENTKTNMTRMPEYAGANAKLLPGRTYKDKLTIGSGRDQIDLHYLGRGHTDGDTFVVFTALRTMHVGDMFAWKALPFIDDSNGGSVVEHPKTLARAAQVPNVDTIVNGHIPVGTMNELREYAAFTADFVAFAQQSLKAGKSAEQAAKEYRVDPKYKGYRASVNPMFGGALPNLEIAYKELRR